MHVSALKLHDHDVPLIAVGVRPDGRLSVTVTDPVTGTNPALLTVNVYVALCCPRLKDPV